MKVSYPDRRQPLVVGVERKQVAAANDGEVRCSEVVALEIGQGDEMCVIVAVAIGEVGFRQRGTRFDKETLADGHRQ